MNMTKSYKQSKLSGKEVLPPDMLSKDLLQSLQSKFPHNYFGLPPYSVAQSAESLAYKSRAPLDNEIYDDEAEDQSAHQHASNNEKADTTTKKNNNGAAEVASESNFTAQRKVARALLTMVSNDVMIKHFLHKGGLDAVLKLIQETKDMEVLHICANCLLESSYDHSHTRHLLDKQIFSSLATLIDVPDDQMKHVAVCIIANLSGSPDMEEVLMQFGVLSTLQALNNHVHRADTMCYLLLSLSNVSPAITMTEYAEQVVRLCFMITQKLDVMKYYSKAIFVCDMYCNYSRLANYSSLLVEEGLLVLLMHLMDAHPNDEIYRRCTETLANLSMNRKNRREIASSGIGSRLTTLFAHGSTATRSSALLITGNLLSSGLFHDKFANTETVGNILETLMNLEHPNQFVGVCFCLCQLSRVESSCAVMVECGVIPLLLRHIRDAPEESLEYVWNMLTSISSYPAFFDRLISESGSELVRELYEEVRFDSAKLSARKSVAQISLNISEREDLADYLSQEEIVMFVKTNKMTFSSRLGTTQTQMTALITLINFNYHCREARQTTLGNDLIELFQSVGLDDDKLNVKYAGLLNVISNEESCCYKLLDLGVHKLLVALQDCFTNLSNAKGPQRKKQKVFKKGQSIKNLHNILNSTTDLGGTATTAGSAATTSSVPNSPTRKAPTPRNASSSSSSSSPSRSRTGKSTVANGGPLQDPDYEYDPATEGELGRELTAATLHNLSLKRPTVTPGSLLVVLSLARNCKTLRVLHCIRALANMSKHSKSKVLLNREARKIFPMLTVSMRCGCEEAERVQHYCAITLTNMLASPLEKGLLMELVSSGAIVDLMVVTLLRINSIYTKQNLGKAFFNLLNRPEIREALIMKLDMLSAILELSKIEYVDLLELCMLALFNITCELRPGSGCEEEFGNKLQMLQVPRFVISRLAYTPSLEGSVVTRSIRQLLGKCMANMSYNKRLVIDFTLETGQRIADALHRVFVLKEEESAFCTCATLFNLSTIPECIKLADSTVLQLIVEILQDEVPAMCVKLCAATLCNMSMKAVYHEGLANADVVQIMVTLLASPQMHASIKKDILQCVYNLVTMYPASRSTLVHCGGVTSLWKLLKVMGGSIGAGGGSGAAADAPGGGSASAAAADTASLSTGGGTADESSLFSAGEGGDDADEEERALIIMGHVAKELTDDLAVNDVTYERRMLQDGIMNIVLKLAKFEMPMLKVDVSFCIYSLSRGFELMKVLKADSADILFWLTIHDTLSLHDLICRNVARSLRCFASSVDEAKLLVKQERFMPVIKALIKSKNEDVLWQTAGLLYTLMSIDFCLRVLLERNLVGMIFEIAASGFNSVRHVCSACLHMVPEHMPNMEDPVVLELVLCLLEADGDKFSELSDKPSDTLPYTMVEPCFSGSLFKHPGTDYRGSWTHQTCDVDNAFSPTLMFTPTDHNLSITMPNLDAGSFSFLHVHGKMHPADYAHFVKDGGDSTSSIRSGDASSFGAGAGGGVAGDNLNIATPGLAARAPMSADDGASLGGHSSIGGNPEDGGAFEDDDLDPQALAERRRLREERQRRDQELQLLQDAMGGHHISRNTNQTAGGSGGGAGGTQVSKLQRTGTANSSGTPVRTHLPLINHPPRVPDNTVGLLSNTIKRDAQQQEKFGPVPHLSMSSSMDSLPRNSSTSGRGGGGGGDGGLASRSSANLLAIGGGGGGDGDKTAKGPRQRVVQISVNDHGNYSR